MPPSNSEDSAQRQRHRDCKNKYSTPRRNDLIEVLWVLDHTPAAPMQWCMAEVLHVSQNEFHDILGQGVILYPSNELWYEQVTAVDFLPEFLLRCTASDNQDEDLDGDEEVSTRENGNPALSWRYSETPRNTNGTEDSRDDEDWYDPTLKSATKAAGHYSSGTNNYDVELQSLRQGHAKLAVELESVNRKLNTYTGLLRDMEYSKSSSLICASPECVMSQLRYKLAIKMQTPLRGSGIAESNKVDSAGLGTNGRTEKVEGVVPGVIKARVECTLRQFEEIARKIRASTQTQEDVCFDPDFNQTQLPSLYSSEFRILFSSFTCLCGQLGIHSYADRLEMVRRCGTSINGDLLRLLGTYDYDEKDYTKRTDFYMGTSCGALQTAGQEASNGDGGTDCMYSVLTRRSRQWDMVDGRYLHGLHLEKRTPPRLTADASETQTFALVWKRSPDLGSRFWSRSMRDNCNVSGWLDVCLPYIQTTGRILCTEVGGLASDDIWADLVKTRETPMI